MLWAATVSIRFLQAVLVLIAFTAAPAFADSDSRRSRSMTGVWLTRPAAPFVLQDVDGPVPQATLMRWELHEDKQGLITGYNTYYSQDQQGENRSQGTLCLVGARSGSKVVLTEAYAVFNGEPVPEQSTTPIFVFECQRSRRNKMHCLGNSLSNIQPTALRAALVRLRRPQDVIEVPEAAREICQPNS